VVASGADPGADRVQPVAGSKLPDITELASMHLDELLQLDIVETVSRRRQSRLDSPAAAGIVTARDLETWLPANPVELLRFLPGVHLVQQAATSYNLGLRGLSPLNNNHTMVLVDGASTAVVLGVTPWGGLPLHLGDIERIEVVRGPGSTLYGANALSGVVSIITRRPLDAEPATHAILTTGVYGLSDERNPGSLRARWNSGGQGSAAVSCNNAARSLGVRVSGGAAALPEWRELPELARPIHGHLSAYARAVLDYRPSPDLDALATASLMASEADTPYGTVVQPFSMRLLTQGITVALERRRLFSEALSLRVSADARRLLTTSATATGADEMPRLQEPREHSAHFLALLSARLPGGRGTCAVGGELTWQQASDFFDTDPSARHAALLAQGTLRVPRWSWLAVDAGVRAEAAHVADGAGIRAIYRNINPRVALIARVHPEHSVRLAGATAYRTPTPFENFINVPIRGEVDAYIVRANPRLRPTQLRSLELGYTGLLEDQQGQFEATVYVQQVTDLAGIPPRIRLPLRFENDRDLTQLGLELGAMVPLSNRATLRLHYSLNRSWDARTDRPVRDWPQHMGGVSGTVELPMRLRAAAAAHLSSSIAPEYLLAQPPSPRVTVERPHGAAQALIDLRLARYLVGGSGEISLGVHNLLGFFRAADDLRQYPAPVVAPTGAAITLGLVFRELAL
jgi:iron complex outermembrane receptor protein